MLWYQAGWLADPPEDATISQAPPASGNLLTVDSRFWPLLAPTVVRYSRSMPWNLSPDRRCHLAIILVMNRVSAFEPPGPLAPRVPPGVFWRLMTTVLPVGLALRGNSGRVPMQC